MSHYATQLVFEAADYIQKARQVLVQGELERALGLYQAASEVWEMATEEPALEVDELERQRQILDARLATVPSGMALPPQLQEERAELRDLISRTSAGWRHTVEQRYLAASTWRSLEAARPGSSGDDAVADLAGIVTRVLPGLTEDACQYVVGHLVQAGIHAGVWVDADLTDEVTNAVAASLLHCTQLRLARLIVRETADLLSAAGETEAGRSLLLLSAHGLLSVTDTESRRSCLSEAAAFAQRAGLIASLTSRTADYLEAAAVASVCAAAAGRHQEARQGYIVIHRAVDAALAELSREWAAVLNEEFPAGEHATAPLQRLSDALDDEVITIREGKDLLAALSTASMLASTLRFMADWCGSHDQDLAGSLYQRAWNVASGLGEANEMALSRLGLARITPEPGAIDELEELTDGLLPPVAAEVLAGLGDLSAGTGDWARASSYYQGADEASGQEGPQRTQ